jgi:hypothetical protein
MKIMLTVQAVTPRGRFAVLEFSNSSLEEKYVSLKLLRACADVSIVVLAVVCTVVPLARTARWPSAIAFLGKIKLRCGVWD